MEGYSRNEEFQLQLLDLISKDRERVVKREELETSHIVSEEKKLELRLGPPGDQDWTIKDGLDKANSIERDQSLLSLGYFSKMTHKVSCNSNAWGAKRGFVDSIVDPNNNGGQTQKFRNQSLPVMVREPSQPCCTNDGDLQKAEKKAFSEPASANTAVVPNSSQKRAAPAPVVGWPPIRSFRKNLATSSSSKPLPESQQDVPNKVSNEKQVQGCKGLFVKINMDGVPIGRKVDLTDHDSYEKLSSAVDELFRDLLAAQMDSSAGGIQTKQEGKEKAITGILDGSGEYTLVYEDNEGDRMLVGDVPWHMFVSSVKRLRVLKSSELSTLFRRGKEKNQLEAPMK